MVMIVKVVIVIVIVSVIVRDRAIFMAIRAGKLDRGLALTFYLQVHGAMCFSEVSAYGDTAYF